MLLIKLYFYDNVFYVNNLLQKEITIKKYLNCLLSIIIYLGSY